VRPVGAQVARTFLCHAILISSAPTGRAWMGHGPLPNALPHKRHNKKGHWNLRKKRRCIHAVFLSVAPLRICCANAASPPLLKGVRGGFADAFAQTQTLNPPPGAARPPPLRKGDLQRYFNAYRALPWAAFLCPVGAPLHTALRHPHGTQNIMHRQVGKESSGSHVRSSGSPNFNCTQRTCCCSRTAIIWYLSTSIVLLSNFGCTTRTNRFLMHISHRQYFR